MTRSAGLLERILLVALLALLCARPLITENYERLEISFMALLPDAGGPTPATTATLDFLLLLVAGAALAFRRVWRHPWLLTAAALLLAAVTLSSSQANDRFLARFAGAGFFISVLAGLALARLIRTRIAFTLVVAGLLASTFTTGVRCIRQVTQEFPDVARMWETELRPRLLEQGYPPDDPLIVNYERRMRSQEATGFLAHPNVTASCLMLGVLTAAGLAGAATRAARRAAAQRSVPWLAGAAAAGVALILFAALWLTGSLGAIVSTAFGLVIFLLIGLGRAWLTRHARATLALLLAGYLAVLTIAAAYGVTHGKLPHPSLAFRWQYWTTAVRAWQDAPLTGLGRANFASAYMHYKSAAATEEVRDPHNLWVSLLVELGPLGLAAGALLAFASVRAGMRSLAHPTREPAPDSHKARAQAAPSSHPSDELRPLLLTAAPVALVVLLLHAGFSGMPLANPSVLLVWLMDVAFVWLLGFAGALALVAFLTGYGTGLFALGAGLLAAILAAFVHNLLDFALMTPGGLAIFMLCAAAAARLDAAHAAEPLPAATREPRTPRWPRVLPVAAALLLVVLHLAAVLLPVQRSVSTEEALAAAVQTPSRTDPDRLVTHAATVAQSTGDPALARIAIRTILQFARLPGVPDWTRLAWLDQAVTAAAALAQLAPRDTNSYLLRALAERERVAVLERLGREQELASARRAAADAYEQAVRWYPTNPRTRIAAGDAWYEIRLAADPAQPRSAEEHPAAQAAEQHYAEALRIDDLRPPEEVQRLRPQERARVEHRLAELRSIRAD